jgi:hypothetical protein
MEKEAVYKAWGGKSRMLKKRASRGVVIIKVFN